MISIIWDWYEDICMDRVFGVISESCGALSQYWPGRRKGLQWAKEATGCGAATIIRELRRGQGRSKIQMLCLLLFFKILKSCVDLASLGVYYWAVEFNSFTSITFQISSFGRVGIGIRVHSGLRIFYYWTTNFIYELFVENCVLLHYL